MNKSKTLIVFWHGIGDCIIATPAFEEYVANHPNEELHFGLVKKVIDSGFFNNCSYVKKTYELVNPWHAAKTYNLGIKKLKKHISTLDKKYSFDKIIYVSQHFKYGIHKLDRTAKELGLKKLSSKQTKVYLSKKEIAWAKHWLKKNNVSDFVFLHRSSGFLVKDLPEKKAMSFIRKQFPLKKIIEPGKSFPIDKSINYSFAILDHASAVVVVDSVFMHAAGALKKPLDFAYFNFRAGVSEEVKPLTVPINVIKGPFEKSLNGNLLWFVKKILIHFFSFLLK